MKLTAVFLLVTLVQVSATGLAQTITYREKNASLEQVFREIRRQTDFNVLATAENLAAAGRRDVNFQGVSVEEVLRVCLAGTGLVYAIEKRTILIKERPIVLEDREVEVSRQLSVRGRVTDTVGAALPGVTVRVVGTSNGAFTDKDGEYLLEGVAGGAVLVFSMVGFEGREVPVNGRAMVDVVLKVSLSALDEVVVKGYYTTSKRFNTGNVTIIKAEEIAKQPVGDLLAALQGRVPGFYIRQSTGAPGQSFFMELRGRNSIANNSNPLFVVDGVPFPSTSLKGNTFGGGVGRPSPFNVLNLADIEEITILKDADATAIYGSRGANGVVLISTKRGLPEATKIDLNYYRGSGNITRKLDLLNTGQYIEMRREALENDGITVPGPTDYDLDGTWGLDRYTDWQEVFIGNTSCLDDIQITISGGNKSTQYRLGGGYRRETTVFPGDFNDQTKSFSIGINHSPSNQRFKMSFSGNYGINSNDMPIMDFTSSIFLAPNAPAIYKDDGTLNWQNNTFDNPFATLKQEANALAKNLLANLAVSYTIFPNLEFKVNLGYNTNNYQSSLLTPLAAIPPKYGENPLFRSNRTENTNLDSWIIEPQFNYRKRVKKNGHFDVLIGATFQETNREYIAQLASGFANDYLITNTQSASSFSVVSYSMSLYRYAAVFGKLSYNWKDKYIINITGRRDGSSRFGPSKQFGNFAALGAAWIFTEEKFAKDVSRILSFGKLRASFGTTGNDQLPDYQFMSTYSSNGYVYLGNSGLMPTKHTNTEFGWESVKKIEAALELGFLADKLRFDISWYRNRTGNQLVGYSLPQMTGFGSVQANLPAVVQNSGLEIEATSFIINIEKFSWSSSVNISIPKNRLVSYPNIEKSSYATVFKVGMPLSVNNRFVYQGINSSTGRYILKDLNNDGQITYEDDRNFISVGRQFHGGFQNQIEFKNWKLSFLFQFVKQNGDNYYYNFRPGYFNENQPVSVLNRWRKSGDVNTLIPRYTTQHSSEQSYFDYSDGRIDDASFIRLKNIALSWDATTKINKILNLRKLQIYFQCQNLLTITNYLGMDPENGAAANGGGLSLPPLRLITGGIQISL